MSSSYSDLLIQTVADVGDVNPNYVEIVFRRCMASFMEKSQVWRTRAYFDMSAATPSPSDRAAAVAAYAVALAASQASPSDLALAQAAEDARVTSEAPPLFTLTRPIKTAAVVLPPTPAVYYTAIATGMRVSYEDKNAQPFWRINPASASGGNQTLEMLPPVSDYTTGEVEARLFWTPTFDADVALCCPSWVFERYGGIISNWTVGDIWMKRRGNRSDQQMGMKLSNDAMVDAQRVRARANAEDPLPFEI